MKKKIILGILSLSTLVFLATPEKAKAEDTTGNLKEDKTDVGVSFKTNDANTTGDNKPFKNNLAVVWKPTAFTFGEQKAVGGIATFNNTITNAQYVIVNDDRSGENAGSPWQLKASFSPLVATDDPALTLTSTLTFDLGETQKYNIGNQIDPATNDYTPNDPKDSNVLEAIDKDAGITLGSSSIKLEAGAATPVNIMTKKTKNNITGGVATQIKNTKLVVKDSTKAAGKSFNGTVIWSLDDTPIF